MFIFVNNQDLQHSYVCVEILYSRSVPFFSKIPVENDSRIEILWRFEILLPYWGSCFREVFCSSY